MIKVALVGLGRMGRNHFRVVKESGQFDLVGVVDVTLENAGQLDGVPTFNSVESFFESGTKIEAAVIATSTETHYEVAKEFLDAGINLLVEKPLASTSEQCEELIKLAESKKLLMSVGHVERFNPAVQKLKEVISTGIIGDPIHFSFTRVGGYPQFVKPGNNVLLDLAVHDLDVLRSLVGSVRVVSACCHKTLKKDVYDTGELLLEAKNGSSASVHVNWITPTKIRQIRVTGSRGVCFVDYMLQTCEMYGGVLMEKSESSQKIDFNSLVAQYQNSDKVSFGVIKDEPLKVQLRAFASELAGQDAGMCHGKDAAYAVELASTSFGSAERRNTQGDYL